jgi:adenosylhomocysteinase
MPVLRSIRERFVGETPLKGLRVAVSLHVTAETANLVRALRAGGAEVGVCAANPLSTQDEVAAALVSEHGASVYARRGEDLDAYIAHVRTLAAWAPQITLDDGADLLTVLSAAPEGLPAGFLGGTEETTTGLVRLRGLEEQGGLACPVIAVNEARTERLFNDHYGTGQSTWDGILRATNLLLAGRTVVILGYGFTGKGVALRARGAGAQVIVCEVDPMRALEARMEGFEVMRALDAAARGEIFVTVTGAPGVLGAAHFAVMKDGAVLANAGHFDVEIDLGALRKAAKGGVREVLPLVTQYELAADRRLNLLAEGRVVNLAAGQGHPAAVMDMSFANQALAAEHLAAGAGKLGPGVHPVPEEIDREVARLKLDSLGVEIDSLTKAQRDYLRSWSLGCAAVEPTRAEEKLRAAGIGDAAVATFARQLARLRAGEQGTLAESDIEPVESLPDADELPQPAAQDAARALSHTVVIKLNGGLGTSMGMTGPKSLLEVKDGMTFLDIVARQVIDLRERAGVGLPLVLMNSFATSDASTMALATHPGLAQDVENEFIQNRVPKLSADTLEPVAWPADPDLEWAPPGHGDLYVSLVTSGMLATLLHHGYHYAFVSNADNLGATLDERILSWFAESGAPFAMEVADRTAADRKGGHLARRRDDGHLVLREIAQTPEADLGFFQDTTRHRFFNTNSLWLDLRALDETMRAGTLDLPLIVNRKTVDPKDPSSPPVIQMETAMGAAIGVLDGAAALRVPRTRFAPVKTTDDLLALRSDAYVIADGGRVQLDPSRSGTPPDVVLDPSYFKLVHDFEARFADGPPSLIRCDRLEVRGDVSFGAGVTVRGTVLVDAADTSTVAPGTLLQG